MHAGVGEKHHGTAMLTHKPPPFPYHPLRIPSDNLGTLECMRALVRSIERQIVKHALPGLHTERHSRRMTLRLKDLLGAVTRVKKKKKNDLEMHAGVGEKHQARIQGYLAHKKQGYLAHKKQHPPRTLHEDIPKALWWP